MKTMITKQYVRKNIITILLVAILITTVVTSGIALYTYRQSQIHDTMALTGVITVSIKDANGNIISQKHYDTITTLAYDFAYCFMFGGALASASGTGCAVNLLYPATTVTTTATYSTPQLWAASLTGIALSTSDQTSSACQNVQTTNGLSPIEATVTHYSGINTPVASLFASWTYTGAGVSIASVCLVTAMGANTPPAFSTTVIGVSGTMTTYAYENILPQPLTSGQSLTVTWQFNM